MNIHGDVSARQRAGEISRKRSLRGGVRFLNLGCLVSIACWRHTVPVIICNQALRLLG